MTNLNHIHDAFKYQDDITDGKNIFKIRIVDVYYNELTLRNGSEWSHVLSFKEFFNHCKIVKRPLSDLTKEIEYNGQFFRPIDFFEIGDGDGNFFEFDHGNIRLIKQLNYISKNNIYHDINYLPSSVVEKLKEWKFDIFSLIPQGIAIDINDLKK